MTIITEGRTPIEEPQSSTAHDTEEAYRRLFRAPDKWVITLDDLFNAVEANKVVSDRLEKIFSKIEPMTVLVEGSAFEQNIDVLDRRLASRKNPQDRIILIDVSTKAVREHSQHLQTKFPDRRYMVLQGDMNNIPLPANSVDLVINDCAINFNETDEENRNTLTEATRVLKTDDSAILLSTVVNRDFDSPAYGNDQENTPTDAVNKPGKFYSFRMNEG